MKANDLVALVLRSPLHGLMGNVLLITVTGRKSGRSITTPVNYSRTGDILWILTKRSRKWWRNISPGSRVMLHLGGRDLRGTAEAELDEPLVAAQLGEYVRQIPAAARALHLRIEDGRPDARDAMRLASERLFVRICVE